MGCFAAACLPTAGSRQWAPGGRSGNKLGTNQPGLYWSSNWTVSETISLNHCSEGRPCWTFFWLVVWILSTCYIRFAYVCDVYDITNENESSTLFCPTLYFRSLQSRRTLTFDSMWLPIQQKITLAASSSLSHQILVTSLTIHTTAAVTNTTIFGVGLTGQFLIITASKMQHQNCILKQKLPLMSRCTMLCSCKYFTPCKSWNE